MDGVRFGVLGPLLVTHEGRDVRIPAGQPQQVLVLLLLHTGQTVSVDHLMSILWDGDPPASARKAVQVHVSQLRRALKDLPGVSLEWSRQGYRLDIPERSLDLRLFRDAQDPDEALGYWRGPALAELTTNTQLANQLEEERLAAVERRADKAIRDGRHHEIIGELTGYVTRHPTRERLRGALMVALHRSGRQADALRTYDEGRRRLAEELGLDPGQELQDLHAAILQGDIPAVPRELPARPDPFVGRRAEIELITGSAEPVIAVHGPGGQGKSALATTAAHAMAERFPDGQLYADLHGATPGRSPLSPAEVIRRFLRALGTPPLAVPTDVSEAAALYRSTLARRKVLVLLDNAVDAAQVGPLLPGEPGSTVLITSRRMLATLSARHVRLDPLPEADALRLLGDDSEAAKQVARACDHLPLALTIAAARLRSRPDWTTGTLARRLADQRHRLDELDFDDLGVRSSFQLGFEGLNAVSTRAFILLCCLNVPTVGEPVLRALLGQADVDRALDPLVDARLVEPCGPERYRVHDLLRLFGAEHVNDEKQDALARALTHYRSTLAAALKKLRPHAYGALTYSATKQDIDEPLRWLTDEAENLLAAARSTVASAALAEHGLAIAHMLYPHLFKQDRVADLVELGQIADQAARTIGTSAALQTALLVRSAANRRIGAFEIALAQLEEVLEARADDPFGQGRALSGIGTIQRELGELEQAESTLARAIELTAEHGPAGAQRVPLSALAQVHQVAGRYEQALDAAVLSLKLAREHEDEAGTAYALASQGQALFRLGRPAEAEASLSECIELCRVTGEHNDEWQALLCRAEVLLAAGKPEQATVDAERCLEITAARGDRYGEGVAHLVLARTGREKHADRAAELLGTPGLRRDNLLDSLIG
ncbi:DNA-binding transcriptional activator of the SARP family [Lentzea albidocapillata subsp. violacea]|uniref:DNA-binding transcriptional activator of the SARP family n=1 Tax=Lentzea albidocapillata subsp. violacea TaxID=128104 RepID=A0A1G8XD05_9PSEU|nr:BTAD domain-containing putative transcriptional regulator [Lentzea albidocapillata]SDJ88351.1 DNA-binding transcriptional activator of the SARP family [Lentzea albidocapillata subsp. violacea]